VLLVRFVHYLGLAMWIGGWLVAALLFARARRESPLVQTTLHAIVASVFTVVIGPGAILTLGSGILWSMAIVGAGGVERRIASAGLAVMIAAGFVGGLLIAFLALPAAARLRAVAVHTEDGQVLPVFETQRKRLIVVSTVAGLLALVSLAASVLAP
jgi:hypothetical protein